MKLVLFIFFVKIFLSLQYCESTKNEVTESLINYFGAKHCIIVDNNIKHIISAEDVKYFASKNIYTAFMAKSLFRQYFLSGEFINVKTAVIIGTDSMIDIFVAVKKISVYPEVKINTCQTTVL